MCVGLRGLSLCVLDCAGLLWCLCVYVCLFICLVWSGLGVFVCVVLRCVYVFRLCVLVCLFAGKCFNLFVFVLMLC